MPNLKKIYLFGEEYLFGRAPKPIITAGIYHSPEQGLISLSSDGTNWITIVDKNLGATQVYNDGDTLSEANCGGYFQRGNNYMFPFTGSITTSKTRVDASNYGPGNYYSSSIFIRDSIYGWDTSYNNNLWGGDTGTMEAMQGPCNNGYHIPTNTERQNIKDILVTTFGLSNNKNTLKTYLKIPDAGGRSYGDGSAGSQGSEMQYWSSIVDGSYKGYYLYANTSYITPQSSYNKSDGNSIRPFKNVPVQPNETRTVLFQ